ncbi:uncharacterized protein F4812DRAFT_25011 [Daldinia caldariorum]|uniref:uncharacterized protein n=1 Tax=Daldinia caldariorum TaxID=326644 RepID=UPI0020079D66|nr:uncharacterized protein F4812DRAFT_25011 [Daldinia caldariorum]KAI1472781.1 hypothetical protein F4812DRAFT_25011 [Daldinia caldariorum]
MSTPGSYRPPLPPWNQRNPQPPGCLGYTDWGYPPPPPGLPPQNPAYVPDSRLPPVPPPIPPRPPGYEIATPSSSNEQSCFGHSVPPTPPGPPPRIVSVDSANPPPYSCHPPDAPSLGKGHDYLRTSCSTLHCQNGFTSIPRPPPNPLSQAILQQPASTNLMLPARPSSTAIGINDIQPLANSSSSSTTSRPPNTEASSPSLAGASITSPSIEHLDAQFQSLSVESRLPTNLPSVSHNNSTPESYPNVPETPPSDPRVLAPSLSDGHIYELPAENEPKGKRAAAAATRLAEGLLPAPALEPSAVTSCIDDAVTFATDWYRHADAPEFLVCSRCYVDHIHKTRFWNLFRKKRLGGDGEPRVCRFSKPRMRDRLLRDALATGSWESALAWMRSRPRIPDCRGVDGVRGEEGIAWYRPRLNDIPGFGCCQACYEDRVLANPFFVNFEPAQPQPAEEIWSCDLAVPFVGKEYEARGKTNDWSGFVSEAKARLSIRPCGRRNEELTYGRKWFVPKRGPEGLVLCSGCYCDQVIHTSEEGQWQVEEKLTNAIGTRVRCGMGIFSITMAMARAHEVNDFQIFWRAVHKLSKEKFCDDDGIEDGTWYTLPSDPPNFGICGACYVAIAEPLDVSRFLVPKRDAQPAGVKWLCCFNLSNHRAPQYLPLLVEMYHTHDTTSFDRFASVYSSLPVCPREEDAQGKHWYGWIDCTICPDCYHDFAALSPLAAKMELKNTVLESSAMCEMYSRRMRDLYTKCSEASPCDPTELLGYSVQRRLVWSQTVPPIRAMLLRAKIALDQQKMLNITSSHYNQMGMLEDVTYGHAYTYGAPGVGYGYANQNLLQGAIYGQQAAQVGASVVNGSATLLVGQLEQQWRAVE